jgi:hypothetical protein
MAGTSPIAITFRMKLSTGSSPPGTPWAIMGAQASVAILRSTLAGKEGRVTITLDRLRDFEPQTPAPGHFSLAVARHTAQSWPSQDVDDYAAERSSVLHRLADDLRLQVESWGGTDDKYSHEVVEIIVELASAVIAAFGPALISAISRKSKGKDEPSVPACRVTNSRGETLILTYEDRKGNVDKHMLEQLTAFLSRSVADAG